MTTPEAQWREAFATAPIEAFDPLDGVTRLVVVAAHPDDETLGAGGLIYAAHRRGLRIDVVVATDGAGSHPDSPTHPAHLLATLRAAEARAAIAILAPDATVHLLALPDGHLAEHAVALTETLVRLAGRDGERTLLASVWRADPHPDHAAAGEASATAAYRTDARLVEYPIWLWEWHGTEDLDRSAARAFRLDDAAKRAKAAAIEAHRTQVAALSDRPGDEALLSPEILEHFGRGIEVLLRLPPQDLALDRLHREREDPWQVDTSFYEQRKRALTMAMLTRERYGRALDVGCSIGALTEHLAQRCDDLVAIDSSPQAVAAATRRLAGVDHCRVERLEIPQDWPDGRFDLIVVSELGYFLSPRRLRELAARISSSLTDDGQLLLCHWRPHPSGWLMSGDEVHDVLRETVARAQVARYRETLFRVDVLGGPPATP